MLHCVVSGVVSTLRVNISNSIANMTALVTLPTMVPLVFSLLIVSRLNMTAVSLCGLN